MNHSWLGWLGIARLGLVQTGLGAVVILTTTTLNRVMVVELALPAMLPGLLVGLYYALQLLRPRLGYGSDLGGRRTPWIVGGMAVLAAGGILAAAATAVMAHHLIAGVALATLAFVVVGAGVGGAGTALLTLLAKRVEPSRRGAAAMVVWVMMIAGFAVTATVAGHFLDPFSGMRLVAVTAVVCVIAFSLALAGVWGVEGAHGARPAATDHPTTDGQTADTAAVPFRAALAQVWGEPRARRFTLFVFVAMLAYSAQDLILEPFAGLAFGLTPGESTQLAGLQNAGVLCGMLLAAAATGRLAGARLGGLAGWTMGGCVASAAALAGLAAGAWLGPLWPLRPSVFALGAANGVFAVAAIGSMMRLASAGRGSREGVRMGLWGAAQAIAVGLGGFLATAGVDAIRYLLGAPVAAYGAVFAAAALLFLAATAMYARVERPDGQPQHRLPPALGRGATASAGTL